MNKNDYIFMVGMLVQEAGGEVKISAEKQTEFMSGLTKKELLYKEDPETKEITIKLADKEEVKQK